jgi:hypothetical protein
MQTYPAQTSNEFVTRSLALVAALHLGGYVK